MIIRSPFDDAAIPDVSVPDFVLRRAATVANKPALIDGPSGRTLTFGELAGNVRLAACGLAAHGLTKGDVVGLLCPNTPQWAVAFLGALSAGAVVSPINSLYTAREIAAQLVDSGARFLVTIPAFIEKCLEATAESPVQEIFVLGEAPGATPFAALLENDGRRPGDSFTSHDDLALLPYSSGTTGLAKGVQLTHASVIAGIIATHRPFLEPLGDVRGLGVLPFFHVAGLTCTLLPYLSLGSTLVTLPRFELEDFLGTIEKYKIEQAALVPPIVTTLASHSAVSRYDLSSLKLLTCGAAPLGAEVEQACAARLGVPVVQGYGMTEAAGLTHGNADSAEKRKPGTVGPCVPNLECQVIDLETGAALGPNRGGEIRLRGPSLMRGYLHNAAATAAAIDTEGWYRTGDIGYVDEDGYFFIVDRVKELIKYKAFPIAPAELEALLLTHPAVADAAVVPSPDEEAGEVPKAFVVLRSPSTAEEIIAFVAERVSPHKKVRRLEVIDAIPRSASGKILRRVLVDRERNANRRE